MKTCYNLYEVGDKVNIDSIKNGIVIDHISAGNGMKLYQLLKLDEIDCSIAIIKNVSSTFEHSVLAKHLDINILKVLSHLRLLKT